MDDRGAVSTMRRTAMLVVIAVGLIAIGLHSARREAAQARAGVAAEAIADVPAASVARSEPALTAVAAQPASGPSNNPEWPHPITAEHQRLYRDVDMLEAARGALRAHDFERARTILAQHRAEQHRAYDDMNEGLTLLTDCMQYPSSVTRERAQKFYSTQTQSMVRREIRRECLEVAR
jgi:hypothetical protein